jgi:hypothetical protein
MILPAIGSWVQKCAQCRKAIEVAGAKVIEYAKNG